MLIRWVIIEEESFNVFSISKQNSLQFIELKLLSPTARGKFISDNEYVQFLEINEKCQIWR